MRKMVCLVLLLIQVFPAHAQVDVRARAYIQPEGEFYAGQQFTLYIQVQTETAFSTSPTFPEVVLDSATAIRPEQLGTSFSERISGKTYVGIRQRYLLSAQKAGTLVIPAYTFEFSVNDNEAEQGASVTVMTEPLSVSVNMPPGLESTHNVAVTSNLSLSESFNPPLEELKVGDAFLRSVTLESDSAMGFLLPEITFQPQLGLTIYSASPLFEDNNNRGRTTGKRTDSASYLLQEEGEYELPGITVQWFDLDRGTLRTLSTEAQVFEVAVNPELVNVLVTSATGSADKPYLEKVINLLNWVLAHGKAIGLAVLLLVVIRYLWIKFASRAARVIKESYHQTIKTELWLRVRLMLACLFFDKDTIRRYLGVWMQQGDREGFKSTQSWHSVCGRYSREGQGDFSRITLLSDVVGYRVGGGNSGRRESQGRLNP